MTTTAKPTTLDDLHLRAHALSVARQQLLTMTQALNAGIEALKANEMPAIRQAISVASAAWSALEAEIQANPQLFVRPRTVAAHGISYGIGKRKGTIDIPDEDRTCRLIRKHLPKQAAVLIVTKATPVKTAISQLPGDVLRRIGVQVTDAVDQVVIRPAETDVDKAVKVLIKATADETASAGD